MEQSPDALIDIVGFAAGPSKAGAAQPARAGLNRAVAIVGLLIYVAVLGLLWWSVSRWLPDQLPLKLPGHTLLLNNVRQRVIGNAAQVLLILPVAIWLEWAIVGWRRSSARQLITGGTPSARTDLAYFLLSQTHLSGLLGQVMTFGLSALSGVWIRAWLSAHAGISINPPPAPALLQIAGYFVVYSFFDYWTHRIGHTRLFWPLHRYHHAATDFNMLTATRAHPATFEIILITLPMAVLGAAPGVMIDVNVLVVALGLMIHSRIDSDFGWWGRHIIQSPNHHRQHHKLDMTYPTANFSMMPIWDRLFGTWGRQADPSLTIGVATTYRHGFWIAPDLLRDYWHFWKGFFVRAEPDV
jgi:sterol desaturase/sphingolipid hydroxylase (fatty acid hydroxylase superfamily)